jgi:hypothetical protein
MASIKFRMAMSSYSGAGRESLSPARVRLNPRAAFSVDGLPQCTRRRANRAENFAFSS